MVTCTRCGHVPDSGDPMAGCHVCQNRPRPRSTHVLADLTRTPPRPIRTYAHVLTAMEDMGHMPPGVGLFYLDTLAPGGMNRAGDLLDSLRR